MIFDDMISTGATMARAAVALRSAGAVRVYAFAAHGLFAGEARSLLHRAALDRIFVSDTAAPWQAAPPGPGLPIEVVGAAPLFANVIRQQSGGRR
jgi:ribose-phosphate pyrophosphokinase